VKFLIHSFYERILGEFAFSYIEDKYRPSFSFAPDYIIAKNTLKTNIKAAAITYALAEPLAHLS